MSVYCLAFTLRGHYLSKRRYIDENVHTVAYSGRVACSAPLYTTSRLALRLKVDLFGQVNNAASELFTVYYTNSVNAIINTRGYMYSKLFPHHSEIDVLKYIYYLHERVIRMHGKRPTVYQQT